METASVFQHCTRLKGRLKYMDSKTNMYILMDRDDNLVTSIFTKIIDLSDLNVLAINTRK